MRVQVIVPTHRCNGQIRLSPVRVIDQDNNQVGIIPTAEAMAMARDAGLDLVEVAPNEKPPVCRIMDYGRFKYATKRHKQKSREQKLKEVRLHPKIGDHDKDRLIKRAAEFLERGDKVQFTMIFRGREGYHRELGVEVMKEVRQVFVEKAKIEAEPRTMGSRMTLVLAPLKH